MVKRMIDYDELIYRITECTDLPCEIEESGDKALLKFIKKQKIYNVEVPEKRFKSPYKVVN